MKPTKLCGFHSVILQASHTVMISMFSFLIDISCTLPDRRYGASKSLIPLSLCVLTLSWTQKLPRCMHVSTQTPGSCYILYVLAFASRASPSVACPSLNGIPFTTGSSDHRGMVSGTMLLNTDWEHFGGKTIKSGKRTIPQIIMPFTGLLFTY